MRTVKKPWIRTAGACGALLLAGSLTLSGCNLTGSDDSGDDGGTSQQDDQGDDNQDDQGDDNQDDQNG